MREYLPILIAGGIIGAFTLAFVLAYAAIKERTAGMELEAHRRAQSVEARAKIMAGDLQRQMEQWMARVEQQYAQLRTEVESSVEQANQQILAARK